MFSSIFHNNTKEFATPVPAKQDEWPAEWSTVFYKDYPRLPKIQLDHTTEVVDLFTVLARRSSRREFREHAPALSRHELSTLLGHGLGLVYDDTEPTRRVYPSAGARYPAEVYVLLMGVAQDVPVGLYHYNVKKHALDVLGNEPVAPGLLSGEPWAANSIAAIFTTGVFWRTQNKYGDRGYRFCLMEAGSINQNIALIAEALSLKCCNLGHIRGGDRSIEDMLDIDGHSESLMNTILIGR